MKNWRQRVAKLSISEEFARKVIKHLRVAKHWHRAYGGKTREEGRSDGEEALEMADRLEGRLDRLEKRLRSKGDRE
jgi:hypothetical protein